ncbi:copper-binding protein [Uliginosibacterium gangwonense]|uniref:copper-binding protein n=1 Tax=Uliginosibacterium gangwonense TaxID=392736 RepID=UPI00037A5AE9|nr:copper-binding protein [Uliginosibacterium gangwonense]
MNTRSLITVFASVSIAAFSQFAAAQAQQNMGHDMHNMAAMSDAPANTELSSGEVRAIDLKARKITIKHGELRNLGMGAMTMVFVIKDGVALPPKLKQGDAIHFRAEQIDGVLTVTSIQR